MQRHVSLPEPDAHARAVSAALVELIRAEITSAGGVMPFARYMEMALYTPNLGYYSGGTAKFGAEGDFVTAPEITPLFGQTLARQVAEVCAASAPRVFEFGAGSGKLAADVLLTLEQLGAPCEHYAILELSGELRRRQRDTLAALAPHQVHKVEWLDAMPDCIEGCIIANEVLDAMPVHLITWRKSGACEQMVAATPTGFTLTDHPLDSALRADADEIARDHQLPDGYTSEICPAARAWTGGIARRLTRGGALLIDYGFPAAEYYHPQRATGTLKAHYRHHSLDDPFFLPGLCDLTAHVDFTSIALAAQDAGLDVLGFTSQADFLINCGIAGLIDPIKAGSTAHLARSNQINHLVSPSEMGELFKVLALGTPLGDVMLSGFTQGDRRRRL